MHLWQSLSRPFSVMAPLEGVTDTVFRRVIASCARPDVFFTEFTSADGFCSPGRSAVEQNLRYTSAEEPLVAQIWGNDPGTLRTTAQDLATRGFAGIDINMGCPDRTVMKNGCGAAMIDTPDRAEAAIRAVKDGIAASGNRIPVSVKTRLGNRTDVSDSWITFLLEQEIDALTVHARTARELSKVPARWESVKKAVDIRNRMGVPTAVIGNGDVADAADGQRKASESGADGFMIGRGIFRNPWAFETSPQPHGPGDLLDVMERHVRLFVSEWGDTKHFAILRKFFKIYVNGFRDAASWRERAMALNTPGEALDLVARIRRHLDM